MIHGDLHFQNILIDLSKQSFILADPRGEAKGSTLKIWHSCRQNLISFIKLLSTKMK